MALAAPPPWARCKTGSLHRIQGGSLDRAGMEIFSTPHSPAGQQLARRYCFLSLRQNSLQVPRRSTSLSARGCPGGIRTLEHRQVGFDRFAEQIWTHKVRPRAKRGARRCPAPSNPSRPSATPRARRSASRTSTHPPLAFITEPGWTPPLPRRTKSSIARAAAVPAA